MPPFGLIQFSNQSPCFIPKQSSLRLSPASLDKQSQEFFHEEKYKYAKVKFKNCYDVPILPIKVNRIKQKDQNSFFIEINSYTKNAISFKEFQCPYLTFYINERSENAALIYDTILSKTKELVFEFENKETKEFTKVKIDKSCIQPHGFEPEELASQVSHDDNVFSSLLKDFLFFNSKFMFFKLELLNTLQNIEFHSLKINFCVEELKKQSYLLKNNSLLLFCTPVVYLEEKTKKFVRLKPGLSEIAVAGKGHGLDFVSFEKGALGSPSGLREQLATHEQVEANTLLLCHPYFDNSTRFHSSLFIGLESGSPALENDFYDLKIQGNSFTDLVPFFEDSTVEFENKILKATSILASSKRRDLKNISKKAFDALSFLVFHEFDVTNKEFMRNLVTLLDYFYNEKEYQDGVLKKLSPIFESIESHYAVSAGQTDFDECAFIQKNLILSLESEKVKGLSLAFISKFIQALARESSTINTNVKEVQIQLK